MKYKLDKKFIDTHPIQQYSAANIFCFTLNDSLSGLFEQFSEKAKEKGLEISDFNEEKNLILSLNEPETIVKYMRKNKSMANVKELSDKVKEYESQTMPLILKRYLTSGLDSFIEISARCFIKNDIQYAVMLKEKYKEIRNPYAKALACLVFAMHELDFAEEFLFDEYEKMCIEYPNESFKDFPLMGLHLLYDRKAVRD